MADEASPADDSGPVRGKPILPPGLSVESTIHRDAEGRWYHDGALVEHAGVRRSFDAWIERHENGRYVVKNSVNWAFVTIDGPPIFVRSVRRGEGRLDLELSDGRTEPLRPETLRQDPSGALYCQVRNGRLTAQFSRRATFELEPILEAHNDGVALRIAGQPHVPERTDTPIR